MRSWKRIGQWRFFKVSYRSVIILPLPLDKLVHEKNLGSDIAVSLCAYCTLLRSYATLLSSCADGMHCTTVYTAHRHVKFIGVRHKWTSFLTFIARAQQRARNNNVFICTTYYEPEVCWQKLMCHCYLCPTPPISKLYFCSLSFVSFTKANRTFFWGLKPLELWMTKGRWYT